MTLLYIIFPFEGLTRGLYKVVRKVGRIQVHDQGHLLRKEQNLAGTLNEYLHECNRHPQAGASMKRQYEGIAVNAIRLALKKAVPKTPVHIHYDFYEADMRRDKMNVFSFADKVIQDALQATGTLKDDGWKYVDNTSHDFFVDKDNPRIEVTIREI